MDINGSSISPKDFLTQAELKYGKKWGGWIKWGSIAGGVLLFAALGPTISVLLSTAIAVVGKLAVLGVIAVIVALLGAFFTNPTIQASIRDQWAGLIKSIAKDGVKINVIDRLQAYADEYLQGKLNYVHEVTDFIRGNWNHLKDQIEQMGAQLEQARAEAAFRLKRSCLNVKTNQWKTDSQGVEDRDEFTLSSQNINMLQESVGRLQKMNNRYELFMALLEKCGRVFDLSIRRTRSIVQVAVEEFKATNELGEATDAISGVIEGSDARTQLFNATMDYVNDVIATNVAKADGFVNRISSTIRSTDVQSDIAQEQLMRELSTMDDQTDAAISSLQSPQLSKQDLLSRVSGASGATVATNVSATMSSGDAKYAELLKKVRKN